MSGRYVVLGLVVAAGIVPARYGMEYLHERRVYAWKRYRDHSCGARAVRGTLRVSVYGTDGRDSEPLVHQTIYVNGPDYAGMEDNDLRGFLDGRFKFGWNQPTQVHVRVGRRARRPRYGELELFRVLQRWDDVALPAGARVSSARLSVTVESGPPYPVEMCLYRVNKDWDPGAGGERRDNVSPPRPGEVWWRDIGYGERSWGLPGTGFASDDHPDADTPAMPLAAGRRRPGDDHIEFSSPELARYVEERVAAGAPLLFLLKLSDDYEDSFGSVTTLYSGNHGDSRNTARRPRLTIVWQAPGEVRRVEKAVFLEHGRSCLVELADLDDVTAVAAGFQAADGYETPTIEMRAGSDAPWRRLSVPVAIDAETVTLRVTAAVEPIALGTAFEATLHDSWVLTGRPEDQEVVWTFRSPSGRAYDVRAVYRGAFLWSVDFTPDEIGRWRYQWTQDFAEARFASAVGVFDVLGGDDGSVREQLAALRDRILASGLGDETERVDAFGTAFAALERAAMRWQTPESFASEGGQALRDLLDEVRAALAGKKVPEEIPLVPNRRPW